MKKRMRFVDIARGLAIIFVVFGHTIVYSKNISGIYTFLYSFHVALFFIISGYTFDISKNEKIGSFLYKIFRRLLIPYFIWSLLFIIPYIVFGSNLNIDAKTGSGNILKILFNTFYANGANGALKQNTALWFLPALFSIEVFNYGILKIVNSIENKYIYLVLPIVWILCGYLYNKHIGLYLPYEINVAIEFGVMFYFGFLIRRYKLINEKNHLNNIMTILLFVIGFMCCFSNFKNVSVVDSSYGNYFLAIFSGLTLSIAILNICSYISKNKYLEYVGKNTMGILIFHKLVVVLFQTKFKLISSLLINSNSLINIIVSIIVVIVSIGVSLIINEIIIRFCPMLIGKRRNEINQ